MTKINPEKLVKHLKGTAEKIDIALTALNFANKTNSYIKVGGQFLFDIDKKEREKEFKDLNKELNNNPMLYNEKAEVEVFEEKIEVQNQS